MNADVVIVGSGVAGALVADRLARAGVSVLMLEAGPPVQRGVAMKTFWEALARTPESPYPDVPYAPRPVVTNLQDYYVQEGPDLFKSTYERRVGGTTWHWLGTAMRHRPADFRLRSRYGVGVDWPLSYEDLEPWYGKAETELGVSGDDAVDDGSPRSSGFPMPPIRQSYLDEQWAAALSALKVGIEPTPQARNSKPYANRPQCCGSANCIPLCPIGAKYDAATNHVARAVAAGARLVDGAVVHQVELDDQGLVAAVLFKRPDGSEERATGKVYVLAAHAIETPKILLMSRSPQVPDGVANSSGQVGRNLMDHPIMLSWGLAADPVYPFRGPLSTSGIGRFRDGDFRRKRPAFRVEIGNDGWSWPMGDPGELVPDLLARGVRGDDLREEVARITARQVRLGSLVEQLPSPENRVVPAFDKPDALGIPRPRIHYAMGDYERAGLEEARQFQDRALKALKCTGVQHAHGFYGAGHIVGTCRMGTSPKTSVTDTFGRTHDHRNLFVVGSSLFPTEGTANPTLTIAALALRTAESLVKELSHG